MIERREVCVHFLLVRTSKIPSISRTEEFVHPGREDGVEVEGRDSTTD